MRRVHLLVLLCAFSMALAAPAQAQVLFGAIGGSAANSDLYIVDPATAGTTSVGPIGFSLTGLSTDPFTGELYGVNAGGSAVTRRLLLINTTTGAGTNIGVTGTRISDISFRSNGVLYGWDEPGNDDLITINTATGATTIVGDAGLSTFGSGLDFSPGGILYFAGDGVDGDLRTVNPATGSTTVVATLSGAPAGTEAISALAFHPVTGVLYAIALELGGGDAFLVTINTTTGAMTTLGQLPDGFDALAWGNVTGVPTMPVPVLLVLAVLLAGITALMLRRRQLA